MARTLLRVPVEAGSSEFVDVEVDTRDVGDSVRLTANDGPDAAMAPFTLAGSVNRIMPALSTILTRMRSAAHAPDEIEMQIGLKIGGETGLIFAKGTAEATFAVTLRWQKPAGATSPHGDQVAEVSSLE